MEGKKTEVKEPEVKKPLRVRARFWSETGEVGQAIFKSNITFGDVLDYYKKKFRTSKKTLKDKYILNGKTIMPGDKVMDLVHVSKETNVKLAEIWVELNENDGLELNKDEPIISKIIMPKTNPIGLVIYKPLEGTISVEQYPESIIKKYGLENYGENSAYCNSPEYLFVSGGKVKDQPTKDLWIIDNTRYKIKYRQMPKAKMDHSMLYLNEGFVLIVGGSDKSTFYYDIKNDEFINCGDLIESHEKPALIRLGDDVFCFNTFTPNNEFAEKNSVTRFSGLWEKVFVNYQDEKGPKFVNKDFAVCPYKNGNFLLLGGKNSGGKTFTYDAGKDELVENFDCEDPKVELAEKKLYRVNDKNCVGLFKDFEKNKSVVLVDVKEEISKILKFNEEEKTNKNKKGNKINNNIGLTPIPENVGNLSMQARINKPTTTEVRMTMTELGNNPVEIMKNALEARSTRTTLRATRAGPRPRLSALDKKEDKKIEEKNEEPVKPKRPRISYKYPRFTVPFLKKAKGELSYEYFG